MKTITFYSYKGGTGRSLALANAGVYLARLGYKVAALDFDLEAPGLNYKFSKNLGEEPIRPVLGVVDYICHFNIEGTPPSSVKEFTIAVNIPGSHMPLQLIPAGNSPSPAYWSSLATLDWNELFYSPSASGVQLMLDLKSRIADEIAPDFLLIDSRTGITEMGGVATTLLADKLICLVLPTLENLEGARAVLRSVKRSRRESELDEIDIQVALSRLSVTSAAEDEGEITNRIRDFLNKEADDLRDTLSCPEIFVLHTESALEITESLRVGSGISPDESILLRDYLRLFASVVPRDLIETKAHILIQLAKERIWDDPESAVKEVEELAESFGHPEAYRALLQFYEVRNFSGVASLKKAQRLWEITRDSDDLLIWKTLLRGFAAMSKGGTKDDWVVDLDFVEKVWRGAGDSESDFGHDLVFMFEKQNNPSRAADVSIQMIMGGDATAGLVPRAIQLLDTSKRFSEANELIGNLKPKLSKTVDFVEAWARHSLHSEDPDVIAKLLEPQVIDTLRQARPLLAMQLFLVLDMQKEANEVANQAIRLLGHPHGASSAEELDEMAELFKKIDRLDEFLSAVKERFPSYYTKSIVDRLKTPRQYRS